MDGAWTDESATHNTSYNNHTPQQAAALVLLVVGVVLPVIHFALFLYNRLLFRKKVGFFGRAPFRPAPYGAAAASSPFGDDRRPLLPN